MNFHLVIMASGIARGRVRTTTTESRKMAAIIQVIKTITKFPNVIGYQQPDLSINRTVAHVILVIGQYASFFARFCSALC